MIVFANDTLFTPGAVLFYGVANNLTSNEMKQFYIMGGEQTIFITFAAPKQVTFQITNTPCIQAPIGVFKLDPATHLLNESGQVFFGNMTDNC
jgi:hypothetical protein